MAQRLKRNANKFTFVWRKSIEKYHQGLIEKSNQLYNELLENEIIPQIERENEEQLSLEELAQIVEKVDEIVNEYDQKIEASTDVVERKALRSERNIRNKCVNI